VISSRKEMGPAGVDIGCSLIFFVISEFCQEWGFSDPTKVQIGWGQYRIDITNDCQKEALKEGCFKREWAQMDVSSTEKTNTKIRLS